ASAGPGLRSGLGLAWRLQRGAVYGWTLGLLLTGLSYGSIGDSVEDLLGDGDLAEAMGAGITDNLVDAFYSTAAVQLALIACGFAISSTLRPRAEEDAGHLEALLAAGLSRSAWLAGHVLVTVGGTFVALMAGGLGMGVGFALTTGEDAAVLRIGLPTVAYVAPVLVLSGLGRLIYGIRPRLVVLAWLPLAFAVVVLLFGELMRFPAWVQDLSPFQHLALAPVEDFRWLPVLVVGLAAALLSAAGQAAFRRRDLQIG
ncbi:MAG TPA: hypothetical protein VGE43_16765, partial [Acidimicrobiales bacterium]